MLYKKDLNIIECNTEDLFIYEAIKYILINKSSITLDDIKYIQSEKYVKDLTVVENNVIRSLTLISAPINWIRSMGYEEVDDNYGVKKKYLKSK